MRPFLIICCAVFLWSCGGDKPSLLTLDEYKHWMQTKASEILVKQKKIGDLDFVVKYRPLNNMALRNLKGKKINQKSFDAEVSKLKDLQYYVLNINVLGDSKQNITNYNISSKEEQEKRLYYLSFQMKNDIRLIDGTDTLACELFHFERAYNLTNHRTFNLAFDRSLHDLETDKTLIIDVPYFGTGPVKLNFSKKDIQKIPTLKFHNDEQE